MMSIKPVPAIMQQIIPGAGLFPLNNKQLIHTHELKRAEQLIDGLADKMTHSIKDKSTDTNIRITGAILDKLKIFGVHYGSPVSICSTVLTEHHLLIPLNGEIVATISGENTLISCGDATMFPIGSRITARWKINCVVLIIIIPKQSVEQAASRRLFTANASSSSASKLSLTSGAGRSFANLLSCLCTECDNYQDTDDASSALPGLQDLLLDSLLQMNKHLWPQQFKHSDSDRRRAGVARALRFIEENINQPIRAQDLARLSYISLRSLQIGFKECFGVGPMTHIKNLRLDRVRSLLLIEEPVSVTVTELANNFGFYNASTFARLYKNKYGELPSATLNRKNKDTHREIKSNFNENHSQLINELEK